MDGARDYKLMTRPVLEALLSLKEYNRFSKGLYEWVGFRTKWFEYENVERVAGETKWSFFKLFLYSIEGIVAFSTAPLALASIMGVLLSFISFLSIIILTVRELIWANIWPKPIRKLKSALFTSPGNVPSSLSTNLVYGHRTGFQHYYAQL